MIRPLTFLCLLAAFGSGLYLYGEKHRAVLLDRDIAHAIHGTEAARERTGLLRAEWALLNDPGRLQTMAEKYLALKTMAPGQFVQLSDLATRLPAPAPAPVEPATQDDALVVDAPPPAPAAAPDAPAVVAVAAPAHAPAPVHVAAKQMAHAASRKPAHPTALADRDEPFHGSPMERGTPLPLAGLPAHARMLSAMAHPHLSTPRPVVVSASPSPIGGAPYVGSALSGGSSLPPPVPLP